MNTIEKLFIKHCNSRGINCHKIPRQDNRRTPDFYFILHCTKIIAEITSLNKNSEEIELEKKIQCGQTVSFWPNSEERLRRKINQKGKQIKNKAKDRYPGILVIYDNRPLFGTLSTENFKYGMYGNDTLELLVPNDPNLEPIVKGEVFGGSRRMTKNWKRYISGLANLKVNLRGDTSLDFFHNYFAEIPLNYSLAWQFADKQYRIDHPYENGQKNWQQIKKEM